jgi:hypothetical protein
MVVMQPVAGRWSHNVIIPKPPDPQHRPACLIGMKAIGSPIVPDTGRTS